MDIQLPDNQKNHATIVPAAGPAELASLEEQSIIDIYKEHGAILFRGFTLDLERFSEFAARFCSGFVTNKSVGREMLSQDGRVQTVNLGHGHFPLHPEMARVPWQPDIAWFACHQPARIRGETNLCDGIAAARAFSPELYSHLKSNSLEHREPVSDDWCRQYLQIPEITDEVLRAQSDEAFVHFSREDGQIYQTYVRPMLHKPMFSDSLAYGSFLVFARQQFMVRDFPTYLGGSEVPDSVVQEIATVTNAQAVSHQWQAGDLLMVDNTRFMHGRNPIGDPKTRRIYTQFGYVSFVPDDYPNADRHPWRHPDRDGRAFDERFS